MSSPRGILIFNDVELNSLLSLCQKEIDAIRRIYISQRSMDDRNKIELLEQIKEKIFVSAPGI